MSFATDLHTLLTSNTSLNNAVGGIYYQILPDNVSLTASNIVYQFNQLDSLDYLGKNNEMDIYVVSIIIVCADTLVLDTLTTLIRGMLDNHMTTKFRDIKFEGSDTEMEGERGQYIGQLKYRITYQN
jgi:hypothetical protein